MRTTFFFFFFSVLVENGKSLFGSLFFFCHLFMRVPFRLKKPDPRLPLIRDGPPPFFFFLFFFFLCGVWCVLRRRGPLSSFPSRSGGFPLYRRFLFSGHVSASAVGTGRSLFPFWAKFLRITYLLSLPHLSVDRGPGAFFLYVSQSFLTDPI